MQASGMMNVSQSALSRQIKNLEDRLGVVLFIRSARGLTLSKDGKVLYKYASAMQEAAHCFEELIQQDLSKVEGHIKLAATVGMSSLYIAPFLPEFLKKYPEVKISIIASDHEPNLNLQEANVAIRPYMKDVSLVQLPLIKTHSKLYASPEYLRKYGVPTKAEDLNSHKLIGFGTHNFHPFHEVDWHLTIGLPEGQIREPDISINLAPNRCEFAEAGLGIASISKEHPGIDKMNLVEVLPELSGPPIEAYFTYPKEFESIKRINVFYEYLREKFSKN